MTVYTVSKHLPTKYFLTRKGKRGEESNVTDSSPPKWSNWGRDQQGDIWTPQVSRWDARRRSRPYLTVFPPKMHSSHDPEQTSHKPELRVFQNTKVTKVKERPGNFVRLKETRDWTTKCHV